MNFLILALSLIQAGTQQGGTGPDRVLDRFLHAVTIRDSTTALSLLSNSAFGLVDSLADADPERLAELVEGFGVVIDPAAIGSADPRAILRDVLTSDALLGLVAMVDYSIGTPVVDGSHALLPVDFSFMGNEGVITVELRRENGRWRLCDYFGNTPMGG